jgi:hypothetical protein
MKRKNNRTGWLIVGGLIFSLAGPLPGLSMSSVAQPQKHPVQTYQPPKPPASRPAQAIPKPSGHAGDWLRRYKDLPPEEQERELQNDPAFRRLSPERQQALRARLQHFSNLPPQQQLRMLNRMETWEHLTPEQKQHARNLFSQLKQLPPDRQRMVTAAVRDLRAMPAEQREQVINSEEYKSKFSDQERQMMTEATRLPLAPAEGGDAGP